MAYVNKKGVRTVVYLQEGEKIIVVRPDAMYRLGYPVEDIVTGRTIEEATRVSWDEVEQKWMD